MRKMPKDLCANPELAGEAVTAKRPPLRRSAVRRVESMLSDWRLRESWAVVGYGPARRGTERLSRNRDMRAVEELLAWVKATEEKR